MKRTMRNVLHGLCILALIGATRAGSGTDAHATKPAPRDTVGDPTASLASAAISIDPDRIAAGDPKALASVGRAIGNAKVVMMGEPWHGDGGAIRARAGLIRYLHEQLGFDVLAFE